MGPVHPVEPRPDPRVRGRPPTGRAGPPRSLPPCQRAPGLEPERLVPGPPGAPGPPAHGAAEGAGRRPPASGVAPGAGAPAAPGGPRPGRPGLPADALRARPVPRPPPGRPPPGRPPAAGRRPRRRAPPPPSPGTAPPAGAVRAISTLGLWIRHPVRPEQDATIPRHASGLRGTPVPPSRRPRGPWMGIPRLTFVGPADALGVSFKPAELAEASWFAPSGNAWDPQGSPPPARHLHFRDFAARGTRPGKANFRYVEVF